MTNNDHRSIKESCIMMGCCRSEVYNRIWRGQIQSEKVGGRRYVSDSSIRQMLASAP